MYQFCQKCSKKVLQADMTGYKNFYFCQKCEYRGIAEEMVKDFEQETSKKTVNKQDWKYNIKQFEKLLKK